jgi:hypothetical protein
MKNYAQNLEKRMLKTFDEHQKLFVHNSVQVFNLNVEVCNIAIQELKKEYDRFSKRFTKKEEVIYFKECYPIIARWQLYFNYLLQLELSLFISHDDFKIKTYKNCIMKLNQDFKKKKNYFLIY